MKKVLVRGDRSGISYGELKSRNGQEVELLNCRRIRYWDGAASIFQMAAEGVKKPQNCKFTMYVESIEILDVIEVIPCTEQAIKSIESVAVWKI